LVFINDILIYSKDESDHKVHLRIVLEMLRQHQLKEKFLNCHLRRKEVKFLSYVVLEKGLSTDLAKIEVVNSWKRPKIVTEIKSFLGLIGNY